MTTHENPPPESDAQPRHFTTGERERAQEIRANLRSFLRFLAVEIVRQLHAEKSASPPTSDAKDAAHNRD